MNLVIVESPAKAKTIAKFLGPKYRVTSSFGHIRDLPTKELGVDPKNDFKPTYVIPAKAKKIVAELKKLQSSANQIILATDEDREGEAISWHLAKILGIKEKDTYRIAFHEITKNAILEALKNPRALNLNLVNAQQTRRILDRLVGYKLSPLLWKKIRKGLSAGRVQSTAVRLVVEREREIEKFQPQEYWEISALLKKINGEKFSANLWKIGEKVQTKLAIKNKKEAEKIINELKSKTGQIEKVFQKEISKTPPPPFTTSTLQQAAFSVYGFSAKRTMSIAQKLYEGIDLGTEHVGLITYMRTDSLNLSTDCLQRCQTVIKKLFGEKYSLQSARYYKNKSQNAQEAHEAIRPTFPEKIPLKIKTALTPDQFKLYDLIWKRTLASQMAAAKINATTVEIKILNSPSQIWLKASGSLLKFDGYLKLFDKKKNVEFLPQIQEGEKVDVEKIISEKKFTQPPARYNEASLIKALEENGIGRPSTYAPIISTIQDRGYISKNENKKLFPEEIGFLVNDLLVQHFPQIVDYTFTAEMEKKLDDIAKGQANWIEILRNFYTPFHQTLVLKNIEIKKSDFQKSIEKKCPQCGSELLEKFGRFGKFIACSNFPKCKYTEKGTEEKAQEEQVKKDYGNTKGEIICEKCGAPMTLKNSRFGSFLGCTNYPKCKNIKKIENRTGVPCPKCGQEIVQKKSKRGIFYGCSGYPQCKTAFWGKPTGEKCLTCGSLLFLNKKNQSVCSNKNCGK